MLLALRLLKKDGFFLDASDRGLLVAPIDALWLGQVHQIRCALDALAAQARATLDPELIGRSRLATRGQDVQAIEAGDAQRAESLSRQHGEELGRNLARLLASVVALSTSPAPGQALG